MGIADDKKIKSAVKERYGDIAREGSSCCGENTIDPFDLIHPEKQSSLMGYSAEEFSKCSNGGKSGLGLRKPPGDSRPQTGRSCPGSGKWSWIRQLLGCQADRTDRKSDRCGHDPRHDQPGGGKRAQGLV